MTFKDRLELGMLRSTDILMRDYDMSKTAEVRLALDRAFLNGSLWAIEDSKQANNKQEEKSDARPTK